MVTKTYSLSLRGIDTNSFNKNPVVVSYGFNYGELPIGKAKILRGKNKVKVEYFDVVPDYSHSLGTVTITYQEGKEELLALSPIPLVVFGGISPYKGNEE